VRFWHREIVRAERELPPERRVFTRFKLLHIRAITPTRTNWPPSLFSKDGLDAMALDRCRSRSAQRHSPAHREPRTGFDRGAVVSWVIRASEPSTFAPRASFRRHSRP